MERYDVCIIGAGAVGCATAKELAANYPHLSIAVIEKHGEPAMETSGLNSGVLHPSFHETPNTLKSRLSFRGHKLAKEYAKEKGIPLLECGMLITIPKGIPWKECLYEGRTLYELFRRNRKKELRFEMLGPAAIKRKEPNLNAWGGIFLSDVAIIDSKKFVSELAEDAKNTGVSFHYYNEVVSIETKPQGYIITTRAKNFYAGAIVNTAGLYADEIAKMAGIPNYIIYPWRGEYYEITNDKKNLLGRLVYPVTLSDSPFKGIHFSPRPDGRVFLGPSAKLVTAKNDYVLNREPPEKFLEVWRKLLPELEARDLEWEYSGIRAKLNAGVENSDFVISIDRKVPPLLNLVGIDSPGLSASMAIGEFAAQLLRPYLPFYK